MLPMSESGVHCLFASAKELTPQNKRHHPWVVPVIESVITEMSLKSPSI
jgi:hypothetical protein